MKNLFKIIMAAGVLMASLAVSKAQSFQSQDFLTGTNLFIQSTTTNTFGMTNTYNYVVTNLVFNGVATTNANAFRDVSLWANRDGTAPVANIAVHAQGLLASSTNVLTFRIFAIPSGGGTGNFGASRAVATSQGSFVFSVTLNGTNDVCVPTNPPTSFLQGAGRLRIGAIESTNIGTNSVLKSLRLNGWTP